MGPTPLPALGMQASPRPGRPSPTAMGLANIFSEGRCPQATGTGATLQAVAGRESGTGQTPSMTTRESGWDLTAPLVFLVLYILACDRPFCGS